MKVLGLLVLMLAVSISVSARDWQIVEITGYGVGEFAVKGTVEKQLLEKVVKPIKKLPAKKGLLEFVVTGYADQTGSSALNDSVAKNRAEEAKKVLLDLFSDDLLVRVNIIAITKGDVEDVKKVVVKWKTTSIPVVSQIVSAPKHNKDWWLIACGTILLAMIVLFLAVIIRNNRKHCLAIEKTFHEKIVVNEKKYVIPIKLRENLYFLPFRSLRDGSKFICWPKRPDARKSLKGCLKKLEYAEQLKHLISIGIIKVLD